MTTTPYRGYGLIGFGPHGWMSEDLATFNGNLGKIDGDVHALFAALSSKRDADASIGMDKVTGLSDALTGKAAAGHSHQLTDLSDVDAAQAGEGYLLARQAGAWVPVSVNAVFGQFSVNINSVDGLADALNGKAASDHNHDAAYLGKTAQAADSLKLGGELAANYALLAGNTPAGAIAIPDAADLDTYQTPGFFHQSGNAYAATGTNYPEARAGCLLVQKHTATGVSQVFITYHSTVPEMYFRSLNSGTWSAWRKVWHSGNLDPASLGDPAGTIIAFAATSTPSGYLSCYGQAVSRTTYASLFAVIGTTFGTGDGSTTFNLPDLRGEFLRGWDNSRGVDSGRGIGTWQDQAVGPHSHTVTGANGAGAQSSSYPIASAVPATQTTSTTGDGIGTETRPRNVAVHYCIKY